MRLVLTAIVILPLAAFGQSGTPTVKATNATPAEVQAKVAAATGDATLVKPGRWEGTMTMHDMEMNGLPPAVQKEMAARMSEPHPFTSCVTPEDVKAKRGFFTGAKDSHCTYDHFTMAGGKIDAAMVCKEAIATMKGSMTGSYTPDSYHFDMQSTTEAAGAGAQGPVGAQKMTVTIDAKRTGECRGDEDGAKAKH